jgi:hypothetical protein
LDPAHDKDFIIPGSGHQAGRQIDIIAEGGIRVPCSIAIGTNA